MFAVLLTACQPVRDPFAEVVIPGVAQATAPHATPQQGEGDSARQSLSNRTPLAFNQAVALSPFALLFPDLRTAPAPTWLRAGTRVSYEYGYATYAQEADDPTPSGAALIQYDVIAKNRRSVVFVPTVISTQMQGQPPQSLPPAQALPGVGDFWFAPEVLPQAETVVAEGYQGARLTMEVKDVAYDVIRIESTTYFEGTTQMQGQEVWAFEVESGLLVFYRQALYNADGSQKSGSYSMLVNQRRLRIPWRAGTTPEWVAQGGTMRFEGTYTLDVGGPPYTVLPLDLTVRFTQVHPEWSEHTQAMLVSGADNGSSPGATGGMQLWGGMWLPPQALAVLEQADVLDSDPDSGITTTVEQRSARQLVLRATGPSYFTRMTYDPTSGRLLGIYQEARSWVSTLYIDLAAVE